MTARLLVVARSATVRAGLRALLDGRDFIVAGEVSSLRGVVGLPGRIDAVIVADPELVSADELSMADPQGPALVVIGDERDSDGRLIGALVALPLRGWAVVPQDAPADVLRAAVTAAVHGLVAFPATGVARVVPAQGAAAPSDEVDEPLTARELQVLDLLAGGLSNRAIARRLDISAHTVKFHVSSIYGKLGASSRTEAVRRGVRRGLIVL